MAIEFYNRNWRVPSSWNGTEDNNNKVSNYSMSFDGSSEYVNLGDSDTFSFGNGSTDSPFSFFIWAKFGNITTNCFISKQTNDTTNSEYQFWQSGDSMGITFAEGVGTRTGYLASSTTVSPSLTTGQWYHIGFTYAGGSNPSTGPIIYVNGVAQSMSYNISSYTAMSNNSASLKIGELSGASGTYNFNGELDHSCFFDYELTQAQVTELYGSSSTGVGNPMAITNGRKPIAFYPLGDYSAFNGEYLVANSALSDYVFDFTPNDTIVASALTALNNQSAFTISGWAYWDTTGNSNEWLFSQGSSETPSPSNRVDWEIYNQKLYFKFAGQTAECRVNMVHSRWVHIATTFDNSAATADKMIVYFDGVRQTPVNYVAPTTNTPAADNYLSIAGRNTSLGFNGRCSNFSVFNTALPATGTESVASLYNYGTPPDISSYSGLQGFWKLDAGSTFDGSNWTVPDESSNSNDGTSSGMTAANLVQSNLNILSPYSRYALSFNSGIDEYIQTGSFDFGTTDFSISLWAKWNSSSYNYLWDFRTGAYTDNHLGFYIYQNKLNLYLGGVGPIGGSSPTMANSGNTWYNIILIKNSNSYSVSVNSNSNNFTYTFGTESSSLPSRELRLGNRETATAGLVGSLSNTSIWNAALTTAQVTEIYNEGKPSNLNNHSSYSNLISWWTLGENSSFNTNWTVLNEISTGPNGVSVNMAEDDLVDGVGTTANGLSSGMGGADNIKGDAPYSTSNALSYGMGADAKSTSVPT